MERRGKTILIITSIIILFSIMLAIFFVTRPSTQKTLTGSAGNTGSISITILGEINETGGEGGGGGGGGGGGAAAEKKEEANISKNISFADKAGKKKEEVSIKKVLETVKEGLETSKKAFIITRNLRIAIYFIVILICIIVFILIYLKVINPARIEAALLRPKRKFIKLTEMARKALKANNIDDAKNIYGLMRFNYYLLNSKDKEAVKNSMDEIYSKINVK